MGTTADGFASGWRVRAAGAWLLPILGLAALLTAYLLVFWPVAFTSYWIEHRLFGLWAGGYHAVNVALHGAMRCCSRGC